MRVGIQGQPGSACDEAVTLLMPSADNLLEYFTDASHTLDALVTGAVERAVFALESPVGVPVPETAEVLAQHSSLIFFNELRREVRHCIMVREDYAGGTIRKIASHAIPLQKHRMFLVQHFPGYEPITLADPGLAAKQLAEGDLSSDTAVIAMPRAAELFGLKVLEGTCQPMTTIRRDLSW